MLKSKRFEVHLTGTMPSTGSPSVIIPNEVALAFAKAGHKKNAIRAFF